jgi:hypothetical protein
MAVRSAAIRWLLAIPLALIALYTVLCMAVYIVGARHLPDRLAPTASRASPGIRAQLLRVEADMAPGDTCVDTAWWRSTDDIADTLLAESVYVRCSIGIEQAAPAYFGRPATQLRPQESLALVALLKGPGWHDPRPQSRTLPQALCATGRTTGTSWPGLVGGRRARAPDASGVSRHETRANRSRGATRMTMRPVPRCPVTPVFIAVFIAVS